MFPYLEDVVVGGEVHGADVDVNVTVVQELLGELLNFFGPGSRPHHHLPVRSDLLENLSYLRLEAHVKHPVGLVQTEVSCPPQINLPGLQEVDEPPRSGDADLHTILDVPQLRALGSSAEDASVLNATRLAELVSNFLNLLSKLPAEKNSIK